MHPPQRDTFELVSIFTKPDPALPCIKCGNARRVTCGAMLAFAMAGAPCVSRVTDAGLSIVEHEPSKLAVDV
jgi:hypothetical protein